MQSLRTDTSPPNRPVALTLREWAASTPGLDSPADWITWAQSDGAPAFPRPSVAAMPKTPRIPMMTARRLSTGSRLALHTALTLLDKHPGTRSLVFSSRHGEIERTVQILSAIAAGSSISPTDFTMAVHNTASGQLTISAKLPLPASSVSAGKDSFRQALYEVSAFLAAGLGPVLHVDFETNLPEIYHPQVSPVFPAYAAAFLWDDAGTTAAPDGAFSAACSDAIPGSLAFLHAYLHNPVKN